MTPRRRPVFILPAIPLVFALAVLTAAAQPALRAPARTLVEPVDLAAVARIKTEAFQRSRVMETAGVLTDVHGPRLSGSPGWRAAAEWSLGRLREWGVTRADLEPYGRFGRGWSLERFSIAMTAPRYMRVNAHPRAWSGGTPGPVSGTPVLVEVGSEEDFEKYRGTLNGRIVMNGRPGRYDLGLEPIARRHTDEDLARLARQLDPAPEGFGPYVPRSFWQEEEEWQELRARRAAIDEFFRTEGVAALLEPSARDHGVVRVVGFVDREQDNVPSFIVSREHYGLVRRLLERGEPVTVEVESSVRFHDGDPQGYNVIAEIPGADPALAGEVVMLGAHLDSWHAGTGATDNAAGVAVMMEVMRILTAIDARPRRTVRLALWSGEEQGYLGSIGYVERHFGNLRTMELKPAHARLSVYYNLDGGSGRIRGASLQGNEAVRPIFEAYLQPFHYLGAATITTVNAGGTDHMPFDAVGLPGFEFIQDPLAYDRRTHHTDLDVYEALVEDDLKQNAAIVATFVYHSAMRDERMPRKRLPEPYEPQSEDTH